MKISIVERICNEVKGFREVFDTFVKLSSRIKSYLGWREREEVKPINQDRNAQNKKGRSVRKKYTNKQGSWLFGDSTSAALFHNQTISV